MPVEFRLPDVGEGLTEAEVVRWLVEPGDTVTEDQPVVEVETDKAVVAVPAPVDGTVVERGAAVGDVVPVGEILVVFEPETPDGPIDDPVDGDDTPAGEPPSTGSDARSGTQGTPEPTPEGTHDRTFAPPSVRRLARDRDVDLATVEGTGVEGRITAADVRTAAAPAASDGDAATAGTRPTEPDPSRESEAPDRRSVPDGEEPAGRERTLAMPATRGLARELDVDIDDVPAVEHRDGGAFVSPAAVREYADRRAQSEPTGAPTPTPADGDAESAVQPGDDRVERIPYTGLRRTIGEQMERSKFTAPHVTTHDELDAEALVDARAALRAEAAERDVTLTYLPFVMKAVVSALAEYPQFNAELDTAAEEIVHKHYYNLGIATATDAGLLVPVVEDVDRKSVLDLASEVETLAERARDRSLSPADMQGGTFTITNYGPIGGEYATPVINYPEVGILGLGRLTQRARVVDGTVVPRHTLPLSLSFDHRITDGATAGYFINHIIDRLEEPLTLLL
jgi:pyruvate dehydrogenase E2 component (dihydrolipoamide acetyltransferase)